MTYLVAFARGAEREFGKLERSVQLRVIAALARLEADPFASPNVKSLAGSGYLLRVGDHRVLFDIVADELLVLVVKVGQRRDVYRGP